MSKTKRSTANDILVLVIGPTGAGKSTFIQYATGQEDSGVGHNLRSCTEEIRLVKSKRFVDGRPIVFVDTPGFDDVYKSNTEVLALVSSWLQRNYRRNSKIDSILYLYRISDNRMAGPSLKNFELFASACDNTATSNITLITTMWKHVLKETGEKREEELKLHFWDGMIESGCKVKRFDDTTDSALDIVDSSLRKDAPLLPKHRIVDKHKVLKETEAGITLNKQLERLLNDQREVEKRLEELALRQENEQVRPELEKRIGEIKQKIDRIIEQIRRLKIKISLPNTIRRRFPRDVPRIGP